MCAAAVQQNMQSMPACTNTAVLIVESSPSLSAKNLNCKKWCGRNGCCASVITGRRGQFVRDDVRIETYVLFVAGLHCPSCPQVCSVVLHFSALLLCCHPRALALCVEMFMHFHWRSGTTQIHALWGNTDIAVADRSSLLFGSLYCCLTHAVDIHSCCIDSFC